MNLMNSKAQAWYMDFAIALLLFTFTIVVYFSYTSNIKNQDKGELDLMTKDAKAISNSLALEGYPDDWDNATVVRIGITDDQQLNATKLKALKRFNYTLSRRKFATSYDYFVYFVNENGEVLNVKSVCGAGYPLMNTTYSIKSAYYYSDEDDDFLLEFMRDTFKADIYFEDGEENLDDMEALISNLSKYSLLVIEHPAFSTGPFESKYKDPLNNYSSRGGFTMLSGQLVSGQKKELFGVEFSKEKGSSISDRNSTVNITDSYLALTVGENIVFRQAYDVQNDTSSSIPALELTTIASFNKDNTNAIAKWQYGNGTVYFFSDFDVSAFNGNFVDVVEEAVSSFIEGTCSPVNTTTAISPKNLAKTERYLTYNSKVVKMIVYVWQ